MKVCLVNKFHWRKGGSETYYFNVAESLRAMGHDVVCFAMEGLENEPCEQSGYFVSARDYNGKTSVSRKVRDAASMFYSKEAKEKFDRLLRDERPDVIHLNLVHRQITFSILDAPYLQEHPVPIIYTSHDYMLICPASVMLDGAGEVCDACLDGRFHHCFEKGCVKGSRAKSALAAAEAAFLRHHGSYRKIDRIISPSDFMRAKLLEGGFPASQVVRMRNFATNEVLACARADTDYTDRERPYLLFFGRLSREKGVDVLVDAFLSIADRIPGWRLVIAGEGPEREAIEAQLAGRPRGDNVEMVGFQQGDALRDLAERSSLSVTPSRWRENMPFSIIEAFAAGTPVVGTRIGGIPELVSEGNTGFLAEPGDSASLAEAIMRGVDLWSDMDAYCDVQSRCRSLVLENCDQFRYMSQLLDLYESIGLEKKSG
ncbi:glycosyl transferase family 1 [Slackia equolifaciens]|uniref:Glycosyl transferase family 1 n=1 Tax=Slackia equolifaciens TaxID=498718 RepID=A0A3N0ARH7_9ACTN|nr:glycosyltransferase family 4 protein [Slackia equolifaciens]RNL37228.1 glycosyl transferase family 1 [Slackia equolifaciens]